MFAFLKPLGALLKAIPLRFYVYAAVAALIGYLLWREDALVRKVKALRAENHGLVEQLEAAEETERRQRKASDAYHHELEDLKRARADTPVRVVRLCQSATRVPEAASGAPAERPEGLPEAPRQDHRAGADIGQPLYELADEADACAIQRDTLIDWIQSGGDS